MLKWLLFVQELSIHAVSTHELLKPKDEPSYSLAPSSNLCSVSLPHPGRYKFFVSRYTSAGKSMTPAVTISLYHTKISIQHWIEFQPCNNNNSPSCSVIGHCLVYKTAFNKTIIIYIEKYCFKICKGNFISCVFFIHFPLAFALDFVCADFLIISYVLF